MTSEGERRSHAPTLHLFCGKIASGKSTLAGEIAEASRSILIGEDFLLSRLYPGEIGTIDDYARSAARLREAIGPHVTALLRQGLDVVLDFQANTLKARAWMRSLLDGTDADHRLHYLRASDELCRARLHDRNAAGYHEYRANDAEFELFTSRFEAPSPEEGFNLVFHGQE